MFDDLNDEWHHLMTAWDPAPALLFISELARELPNGHILTSAAERDGSWKAWLQCTAAWWGSIDPFLN